jgi:hypothetical protein
MSPWGYQKLKESYCFTLTIETAGCSETFPITDKNTECHNPQEHINILHRKYVKSHKDFHIPLGYFTFHLATFLFMTTTIIILHIDDNEENDNVNT